MKKERRRRKAVSCMIPPDVWVSIQKEALAKGLTVSELLRRDYLKIKDWESGYNFRQNIVEKLQREGNKGV